MRRFARTLLAACVIVARPVAVSAVEAKKPAEQTVRQGAKPSTYQGATNMGAKMNDTRQAKPDNAVQARLRANPGLLKPLPAEIVGRVTLIKAKLTPQGKARIEAEAAAVRSGSKSPQQAEASLRASGIDFGQMPIEDAIMMMFFLISEDARNDMRDMMSDMDKTRQHKEAMRQAEVAEKDELAAARDSLSDMSELQQLRMQKYMDRRQKALETLSNLMKKSSDASSSLVQNMK